MKLAPRRHLPWLLALALAACAAVPPREETPAEAAERRAKAPPPTYNLAGYPPAVKAGYIDGCETAKGSDYGRKDEKRMAGDPQYRMGWNDGHAMCQKR